MEVWKPIKGYEGYYEVSNKGNVKSLTRPIVRGNAKQIQKGKLLKNNINSQTGYPYVFLAKKGINKRYSIHRLVAEMFIPNIHNKPVINHIDGTKNNNDTSNLEWVTQSENMQHAHDINSFNKKRIGQFTLDGTFVNEYDSIKDASISLGKNKSIGNIVSCCKGNRLTANGYKWAYIPNEIKSNDVYEITKILIEYKEGGK